MGTCQVTASRRVGGQREEFLQPAVLTAGGGERKGVREIRLCAGGRRVAGRKGAPPAIKPLSLPILEPG